MNYQELVKQKTKEFGLREKKEKVKTLLLERGMIQKNEELLKLYENYDNKAVFFNVEITNEKIIVKSDSKEKNGDWYNGDGEDCDIETINYDISEEEIIKKIDDIFLNVLNTTYWFPEE